MKSLLPFLLFAGLSLLSSCNLDEEIKTPKDDTTPTDTLACTAAPGIQSVIFKSLAVGQKSRFVFFTGENYFASDGEDFQYHPDTLVLEITGKEDARFIVRECITAESQPHPELFFPDSVLQYYLGVENGYLRPRQIPGFSTHPVYSRLFFTREIPLPLNEITTQEMQLTGWKTAPVNHGMYQEGFCTNCGIGSTSYPHLNFVVDNADMSFDGMGYTWVYATNSGLLRCFYVSPWTGKGVGWDLLPD